MPLIPRPLRVLAFRLGSASPTWPVEPADLWVHGASMGEIAAAGSLLSRLPADGPTVYLTSGTPEGLARAERRDYGHGRGPGPMDRLGTSRLLRRLQPRAIWLVESELWPGLLGAARDREIRVGVVGARVSERTFQRCRHTFGRSWFRLVGSLVWRFAAADTVSARRLLRLGVPEERIRHCGRIKIPPEPRPDAPIARLMHALAEGDRRWIVGGCTHAGEEELLLDAAGADAGPLMLAPRHLDRLPEVERAVERAGRRPLRRTALGEDPRPLADDQVLLLDTLGELPDAYTRARWVFIGGSVRGPRAHDLLEPLRGGARLLAGPQLEHQEDEAARLRGARVLEDFQGRIPEESHRPLNRQRLFAELDGREATLTWMRGGGLL